MDELMTSYNGVLDIVVVKNPDGDSNGGGERWTGMQILPEQWRALYIHVLGVPEFFEGVDDNAPYDVYSKHQEESFRNFVSTKGYKMLSRISDIYRDAKFLSDDVRDLKEECLRLKCSTSNELALLALEKLKRGCEFALETNSGLVLSSD